MDHRMGWLALGLALGVGLVACSSKVQIIAESTSSGTSSAQGTSSGHPGGTGGTSGSGSTAQGSSSGSPGGTGGMSSGSASSGTGAGPVSGKVVTADNDIGQYASFTVAGTDMSQKVLNGPFFVTDVHGEGVVNPGSFDVVTGGNCSVPMSQHTPVLAPYPASQASADWHGIKLPILAGQTLCVSFPMSGTYTVLGFRPY